MIYFDMAGTGMTGETFVAGLKERGVLCGQVGRMAICMITHCGVSLGDAMVAVTAVEVLLCTQE